MPNNPRVRIETELGDIVLELYPEQAPITVGNFLGYVDARHYDGGNFFRTVRLDNQPNDAVRIEVVQGGGHPWWVYTNRQPPIQLERTSQTGLRHTAGAVSMARLAADTALSSFFICLRDEPELDFGGRRNPDGQGFAAFGRVVEGMDVVSRIHQSPCDGQALLPPIRIHQISRA